MQRTALVTAGSLLVLAVSLAAAEADSSRVVVKRDDAQGEMRLVIDGKEALVYQYGKDVDLPHYYPVLSPSGKPLTIQKTDPYPHHRSVWFADTVRLAGQRQASFYNALYSKVDPKDPKSPVRDRIRHVAFLSDQAGKDSRVLTEKLVWEADLGAIPMLDELRELRVEALGDGEYLLALKFTVTAAYGEVQFLSDAPHYAWPYVRMHPDFSVDHGGTMINSEGGVNQSGTHEKVARWIDYSNTVGGATEGLAIFSHSANEHPHTWLTRDYGTFGPRRAAEKHGKPFLLKKGASLVQRVGILVHRGDLKTGRVSERYQQYLKSAD